MSVIKYDADDGNLFQLPYKISADALSGILILFFQIMDTVRLINNLLLLDISYRLVNT